jgi:hypothetical protein
MSLKAHFQRSRTRQTKYLEKKKTSERKKKLMVLSGSLVLRIRKTTFILNEYYALLAHANTLCVAKFLESMVHSGFGKQVLSNGWRSMLNLFFHIAQNS